MATIQELLKNGIQGPQTTVDSISGGMSNRQTIPTTTPTRIRDILKVQKPISMNPLIQSMGDRTIVPGKKMFATSENLNPSGTTPEQLQSVASKMQAAIGGQQQTSNTQPEYPAFDTSSQMPQFTGNDTSGGSMGTSTGSGMTETPSFDLTKFNPDDYFNTNVDNFSADDLYAIRNKIVKRQKDIYSAAIDPQRIAQITGGVFSPDQMRQFTQLAAKQYDDAIDDIDGKIKARESASNDKNKVIDSFYDNVNYKNNSVLGFNPDQVAGDVLGTLSEGQGRAFIKQYQNSPDKERTLSVMGLSKMSADQKSKLEAVQKLAEGYKLAVDFARENEGKIPSGFYNAKIQDVQKFANNSKDPFYVKFNSLIQSAQAEARTKITGVALSENELKLINSYMVEPNDTVQNALTKMQVQKALLDKEIQRKPFKALGVTFTDLTLEDIGLGNSTNNQQSSQSNIPQYEVLPDGSIKIKKSFKNVGTDTNTTGSVKDVNDAMSRIARNESDGNGGYFAIGHVVTSGQYKGERAIGKYQIMPGNVGPWSKEILGYEITPQQLYQSPQLQDAIAKAKLQQAYNKYGSWSDAASVWFTGRPAAQGSNAKDVLGTSGAQYVNKFNA